MRRPAWSEGQSARLKYQNLITRIYLGLKRVQVGIWEPAPRLPRVCWPWQLEKYKLLGDKFLVDVNCYLTLWTVVANGTLGGETRQPHEAKPF